MFRPHKIVGAVHVADYILGIPSLKKVVYHSNQLAVNRKALHGI